MFVYIAFSNFISITKIELKESIFDIKCDEENLLKELTKKVDEFDKLIVNINKNHSLFDFVKNIFKKKNFFQYIRFLRTDILIFDVNIVF